MFYAFMFVVMLVVLFNCFYCHWRLGTETAHTEFLLSQQEFSANLVSYIIRLNVFFFMRNRWEIQNRSLTYNFRSKACESSLTHCYYYSVSAEISNYWHDLFKFIWLFIFFMIVVPEFLLNANRRCVHHCLYWHSPSILL